MEMQRSSIVLMNGYDQGAVGGWGREGGRRGGRGREGREGEEGEGREGREGGEGREGDGVGGRGREGRGGRGTEGEGEGGRGREEERGGRRGRLIRLTKPRNVILFSKRSGILQTNKLMHLMGRKSLWLTRPDVDLVVLTGSYQSDVATSGVQEY